MPRFIKQSTNHINMCGIPSADKINTINHIFNIYSSYIGFISQDESVDENSSSSITSLYCIGCHFNIFQKCAISYDYLQTRQIAT